MRDFPIFTTDYGVSSLTLKEIPYRSAAYICIRDVQDAFWKEHLDECIQFCRMAGADCIYAAGYEKLESYPLYTKVLRMRGKPETNPEMYASLFPVTEKTVSRWREIYNGAMKEVDNASTLESREEGRILESGGAYFVHDSGDLLGIGWVEDNMLLAIAAVRKGAGERVLRTLMSLTGGEPMTLEVASTNEKAMRLYEKMGFLTVEEVASWHRVG